MLWIFLVYCEVKNILKFVPMKVAREAKSYYVELVVIFVKDSLQRRRREVDINLDEFDICGTVHHHSINKNNQRDVACSIRLYYVLW